MCSQLLLAGPISLQIVGGWQDPVGARASPRPPQAPLRDHRGRSEIADGGELQSETQAVLFTPAARDLCQIIIVEVVVAAQLVRRPSAVCQEERTRSKDHAKYLPKNHAK
jgi:hypothetical protein